MSLSDMRYLSLPFSNILWRERPSGDKYSNSNNFKRYVQEWSH